MQKAWLNFAIGDEKLADDACTLIQPSVSAQAATKCFVACEWSGEGTYQIICAREERGKRPSAIC